MALDKCIYTVFYICIFVFTFIGVISFSMSIFWGKCFPHWVTLGCSRLSFKWEFSGEPQTSQMMTIFWARGSEAAAPPVALTAPPTLTVTIGETALDGPLLLSVLCFIRSKFGFACCSQSKHTRKDLEGEGWGWGAQEIVPGLVQE